MSSVLLALDFGGTKHAAAIASSGSSTWQAYQRQLSPPDANAQIDLDVMRSLIKSVLNGTIPEAIGVSFGGPVDFTTGVVRLSHHVPGWENLPLQQILEAEFGVPVQVDNDANVAALGEHRFGAGQGRDHLMYITVSTGVGGGWILNGQPWRGAAGMAGEIGHTVVDPAAELCLCGKRGCVERLVSGSYMAQRARESLRQPKQGAILRSLLASDLTAPDLAEDWSNLTAQHLSQAAAQGDLFSQEILDRGAWALGVGIGNTANLINPQCFVLGGGVMKAGDRFWQVVRDTAHQTALPQINFEIVPAALGDDAPLWGSIALVDAMGA